MRVFVGVKMMTVVEAASAALQDRRLQRCLVCDAVNILPLSDDWLRPRGFLYSLAKKQYGFLQEDKKYPFTSYVSVLAQVGEIWAMKITILHFILIHLHFVKYFIPKNILIKLIMN